MDIRNEDDTFDPTKMSSQSLKQLPNSGLLKNIHQLTNNLAQIKQMNIILTTNQGANAGGGEEADGSEHEEEIPDHNDSCSTNDSMLDKDPDELDADLEDPSPEAEAAHSPEMEIANSAVVDPLMKLNPTAAQENKSHPAEKEEEVSISPEEYAKYKRDILMDLQKEKQKIEELNFNHFFDFSQELGYAHPKASAREEDEAVEINQSDFSHTPNNPKEMDNHNEMSGLD